MANRNLQFDEALRSSIRENLKDFTVHPDSQVGMRRAAVAVTVVNVGNTLSIYDNYSQEQSSAALVLTRRSSNLKNHAGQWAFPGGSMDPGETAEQSALRELEEEVGAKLGGESVLGRLDDFTTRSGFTITPVVIWGGLDLKLDPNLDEVESIHRIPLGEFMRGDAPLGSFGG